MSRTSSKGLQTKLAKLEEATKDAEKAKEETYLIYKEAEEKLNKAKEFLKELDPELQEEVPVNVTVIPELMEKYLAAKNEYETQENRYNTNLRYFQMVQKKIQLEEEKLD